MNDCMVVIATYNEARTIWKLLEGLQQYAVVIVDDSTDSTALIAQSFVNTTIIKRGAKMGVASAYMRGFRRALEAPVPRYVVQMDAGMTHDPADVPRLLDSIETAHGMSGTSMSGRLPGGGACVVLGMGLPDLVIGSRFVRAPHFLGYRMALSLAAAWGMRGLGIPVRDATSGFRCWRASLLGKVLQDWNPKATGFAFQLEMLYRAWDLCGGRVVEMPIAYQLTNSSFRWGMVAEALQVYAGLWMGGCR